MTKRVSPAPLSEVIYDERTAFAALSQDEVIGLDIETSGLSPWHDHIAVISMYGEQSGSTVILHVKGRMSGEMRYWLTNHHALWVGHNVAGFDMLFLANNGVDIDVGKFYDTLIGEQMTLSSGRRDVRVRLQDAVYRRLGVHLKKGQGESSWMQDSLTTEQLQYCVEDVFYLPKLMNAQLDKLRGTKQMAALEFEQRLVPIVARMSLNGLPLDLAAMDRWRGQQVAKELVARRRIEEVFGPGLNTNSPKQVQAAYAKQFGIELESVDVEHLTALSEVEGTPGEVANHILIARRAKKRTGMYDDEWVGKYSHKGRVHARFWQVGTDTFRFSSSEPNFQQIPRDGRGIFGGLFGYHVVKCDFSQLEVRVAAGIAQDTALLAALDSEDIHMTVASSLYGIPMCPKCPKEYCHISKEQRRIAKAAVFTLLFGGSAGGLVRYAKMSGGVLDIAEAQRVVHRFFSTYEQIAIARQRAIYTGRMGIPVPITLPNGARRVLAPIDGQVRPSQILNTMVQGSAAIGMKHALFECERDGLLPYLGLPVHDELVACVPMSQSAEYAVALSEAMKRGMAKILGTVTVGTEYSYGTHWSCNGDDHKACLHDPVAATPAQLQPA